MMMPLSGRETRSKLLYPYYNTLYYRYQKYVGLRPLTEFGLFRTGAIADVDKTSGVYSNVRTRCLADTRTPANLDAFSGLRVQHNAKAT